MEKLEQIKLDICARIEKYDTQENTINNKFVNETNTIKELFEYLFAFGNEEVIMSNIISDRLKSQVITIDKLEEWFGEEFLTQHNVYYYGKHIVYGGFKNVIVLGCAQIEVGSDALVYSFQNSTVNLTHKSTLYANDNSVFYANHYSNVYVMKYSNVKGQTFNYSHCTNNSNNAFINAFDNSEIDLYYRARVISHGNSIIRAYNDSIVLTFNVGNCCISLQHNAICYCNNPSAHIICENKSTAIIDFDNSIDKIKVVGMIEAKHNSLVKLYCDVRTMKVRDNAVVLDYTDTHCHPFDDTFILWMNKMQAWYNTKQSGHELTFIQD